MNHEEYLRLIDRTIEEGRYKASWDSLSGHKIPDWYYEGKFGIFIHWGIYSVPQYACEWYPRWMYNPGSREYEYHVKNFGDPSKFGYKDFIPMFKGEKFNDDERTGAQAGRTEGLMIYRLPSSSRAYPLKLENKAEAYGKMFRTVFGAEN